MWADAIPTHEQPAANERGVRLWVWGNGLQRVEFPSCAMVVEEARQHEDLP
jgi:hypothetical protein